MSMVRCETCDKAVDTDFDVEGWQEDDTFLCERCAESYTCEKCGESVGTKFERKYGFTLCKTCDPNMPWPWPKGQVQERSYG